jgi:hypothetical protein
MFAAYQQRICNSVYEAKRSLRYLMNSVYAIINTVWMFENIVWMFKNTVWMLGNYVVMFWEYQGCLGKAAGVVFAGFQGIICNHLGLRG